MAQRHRAQQRRAGSRPTGQPGGAPRPEPPARTWMTLPYFTTSPCTFLFSVSFCFCSIWAACCTDTGCGGGRGGPSPTPRTHRPCHCTQRDPPPPTPGHLPCSSRCYGRMRLRVQRGSLGTQQAARGTRPLLSAPFPPPHSGAGGSQQTPEPPTAPTPPAENLRLGLLPRHTRVLGPRLRTPGPALQVCWHHVPSSSLSSATLLPQHFECSRPTASREPSLTGLSQL